LTNDHSQVTAVQAALNHSAQRLDAEQTKLSSVPRPRTDCSRQGTSPPQTDINHPPFQLKILSPMTLPISKLSPFCARMVFWRGTSVGVHTDCDWLRGLIEILLDVRGDLLAIMDPTQDTRRTTHELDSMDSPKRSDLGILSLIA
jgi:hypothetical protein